LSFCASACLSARLLSCADCAPTFGSGLTVIDVAFEGVVVAGGEASVCMCVCVYVSMYVY
jgi:hypothetical protein